MRYIIGVKQRDDAALAAIGVQFDEYFERMKMYVADLNEAQLQAVVDLDNVTLVEADGEVHALDDENEL